MSENSISNEELNEIIRNMQFPKDGNVNLITDQGIQYVTYTDTYGNDRKYEVRYGNETDSLEDGEYAANTFEENIYMADFASPSGEITIRTRHTTVRLKR